MMMHSDNREQSLYLFLQAFESELRHTRLKLISYSHGELRHTQVSGIWGREDSPVFGLDWSPYQSC